MPLYLDMYFNTLVKIIMLFVYNIELYSIKSKMFQDLQQIQRIKNSVSQLEKQNKQFKQLLQNTKQSTKQIQSQVDYSIDKIITSAREKLELCSKLQEEVQNQNFISTSLQYTKLIDGSIKLPEWFEHVCHSQFLKQKKKFDASAIKLYRQHGLAQKKKQLQNEINSFTSLNMRYNQLNRNQNVVINLNHEVQLFQNKTRAIFSRFANFVQLISQKSQARKSLNYVNNKANPAFNPLPVNDTEIQDASYRTFYEKVLDVPKYNRINHIPYFQHPIQRNLAQQYRFQPQYYENSIPLRGGMLCAHHRQQVRPSSVRMHKNLRSQSPYSYNQYESRFNYRDHLPKRNVITTTLSNFYRE